MIGAMRALLLFGFAACGRVGFEGGTSLGDASVDGGGLRPLHQYRLLGNYDDDYGGPSLTSHGGELGVNGYTFDKNEGLSLEGAMPRSVYTLDIVLSFETLNEWNKIVDYEDLGPDTGFYTYAGSVQYVIVASLDFISTESRLTTNTMMRLTTTRDASANVVVYIDGDPAHAARATMPQPPEQRPPDPFRFIDSPAVAEVTMDRVYFAMDDNATMRNEAAPGVIRRIRIYDVALSAREIKDNP